MFVEEVYDEGGPVEMKKRLGIGCLIIVVLVGTLAISIRWASTRRFEAEFQEQLRLARAEGLPTSAKEYAARIPTAAPADNAALLYRKVKETKKSKADLNRLTYSVILSPSEEHVREARLLLQKQAVPIRLAQEAVRLPKCWFDRKWEDGAAVLMPEFADMKYLARLLILRASLAASQNRPAEALEDMRRIQTMGNHAAQEPATISHLVAESLHRIALLNLALWSFRYRLPVYARELERGINLVPKPNVKAEWSGELYSVLSLIELVQSPEGREKLGLKPEDLEGSALAEKIFPLLIDPRQARVDIVKADRDYWAALDLPYAMRKQKCDEARLNLFKALLAFPTAARLYELLSFGDDDPFVTRRETYECRQLQYRALARALSANPIPKTLKTDDLKSPFDGKPVRYRFDGKQIVIEIGAPKDAPGAPSPLKLPTDSALKK